MVNGKGVEHNTRGKIPKKITLSMYRQMINLLTTKAQRMQYWLFKHSNLIELKENVLRYLCLGCKNIFWNIKKLLYTIIFIFMFFNGNFMLDKMSLSYFVDTNNKNSYSVHILLFCLVLSARMVPPLYLLVMGEMSSA